MAITVINKPIGHKLSTTQQTAQIIDDGTGNALVYTGDAHGLSDGDYVLIESNFDSYNGYKYVDSIAYDSFKIKDSENSDYTEFVQNADITFYISILNHGFQCVHLPIVYELQSDIWPNNTAEETYTPNTVVSQDDADGYTQINLIEALSDPTAYAKIELVGTGELAGVYTIISVLQPWSVIIDLAYDAGNSFSGYVVVKYYDNYAINVNVYAGLTSDHRWESRKPFELAATLKFVPDENGSAKFSIAELLRSYINNRNNLTLDTLPNNLDFIVGFYIEYFESYDQSDGEDITTFEGEVTEDSFVGYAINAKLAFKSESISHLSDYLDSGNIYARWLTIFESPIIMVGQFFDISFLNQHNNSDILITVNGVDYLTIENPGIGITRVPIEAQSGDTQLCVKAFATGNESLNLAEFQNNDDIRADWTTGSTPTITTDQISDILFKDYQFTPGTTYTITVVFTASGSILFSLFLRVYDDDFTQQESATNSTPTGVESIVLTFTAGSGYSKIGLVRSIGSGVSTVYINSITISFEDKQVTEEICLPVIEECENTFSDDEARLTEDDILRLLE